MADTNEPNQTSSMVQKVVGNINNASIDDIVKKIQGTQMSYMYIYIYKVFIYTLYGDLSSIFNKETKNMTL